MKLETKLQIHISIPMYFEIIWALARKIAQTQNWKSALCYIAVKFRNCIVKLAICQWWLIRVCATDFFLSFLHIRSKMNENM